jgi:hypothetical protein
MQVFQELKRMKRSEGSVGFQNIHKAAPPRKQVISLACSIGVGDFQKQSKKS